MAKREFFLKPITILGLIIIFTIILFFAKRPIYALLMLVGLLLLAIMNRKGLGRMVFLYLALFAFVYLVRQVFGFGQMVGVFVGIFLIALRLFPVFCLASIMLSFDTQEIMNSLWRLGLPINLAIAVAVFFRFLPEYFSYLGQIREGAVVRGMGPSITRPLESLETFLVPLIYKAFETGENITAALMTKGVQYDGDKTCYRNIDLGPRDYLALASALVLLGVSIWMR